MREGLHRIMGQTTNDCRFRNFTSTNSLRQQRLLVGRQDSRLRYVLVHNFLRKLFCGSKKWRWLNQWMIQNLRVLTEELMVQTMRYSTRKLLQHWTESSRIPASRKKVSLEEMKAHKEDRFLRERQIAYLIYEYFRVTGANDSVENCADLFTVVLRRWYSEIRFKKVRNSIVNDAHPIWWHLGRLYTLRIRKSEKLKSVLELYNVEIHQKKAGLDCHRLKTMVKSSIEHSLRMKIFEARNGNYETSAVVNNLRTKQREQRSPRDCWQWKANGQCSIGDNCSFRHDVNKRAKSTQLSPSPRSSTQQSVKNASRTRKS